MTLADKTRTLFGPYASHEEAMEAGEKVTKLGQLVPDLVSFVGDHSRRGCVSCHDLLAKVLEIVEG